jgi:hypothetical protein
MLTCLPRVTALSCLGVNGRHRVPKYRKQGSRRSPERIDRHWTNQSHVPKCTCARLTRAGLRSDLRRSARDSKSGGAVCPALPCPAYVSLTTPWLPDPTHCCRPGKSAFLVQMMRETGGGHSPRPITRKRSKSIASFSSCGCRTLLPPTDTLDFVAGNVRTLRTIMPKGGSSSPC